MERPSKRARLLDEDASSSSSDEGGVPLKINEEYAKRHQHNAQRNERQRLEEKYKEGGDASESDSDSESEDEGELATEQLDTEIMATLNALRSKDPTIYNKDHTFYKAEQQKLEKANKDKTKPLHLRDYHRQNLLNGDHAASETPFRTHAEKQDDLKKMLVGQMHDAPKSEHDTDSDDDDLLVRKPGQDKSLIAKTAADVALEEADADPENYLNKFMTSRAWVASESSKYQPFESDDEDEDLRADKFEHAYNLRFEDPAHANEKLLTHSRDMAAKHSVRRDEPKGRKKARLEESALKEASKAKREEEKARLRRLKIEEAQEKWLRLKEAAGLKKQNLPDDKLLDFLERGFDGGDWDQEMQRLLGEAYYNDNEDQDVGAGMDVVNDKESNTKVEKKNKKLKKPSWDDDIDIGDIVPDFDEEEERQRNSIQLSDDDDEHDQHEARDIALEPDNTLPATSADNSATKSSQKRQNRLARQKIAEIIDTKLVDDNLPMSKHTGFRYREGSPTTFGLAARDILMADDSQLNQYAGLKKLATYRDQQKKERDNRKLGKKARLRKWRRETFGKDEEVDEALGQRNGEDTEFEKWFNESRGVQVKSKHSDGSRKRKAHHDETNGDPVKEGKHKKKRKKSIKADAAAVSRST